MLALYYDFMKPHIFFEYPKSFSKTNNDDLVKSLRKDGFVKSSPAAGGTRRAKTEE
jgi:hypothetical protein